MPILVKTDEHLCTLVNTPSPTPPPPQHTHTEHVYKWCKLLQRVYIHMCTPKQFNNHMSSQYLVIIIMM